MSLRRILRSHLWPYRRLLGLVIVFQTISTGASLVLPSLNAEIIDKGVLARNPDGSVGDNDVIRTIGAWMLGFTAIQATFVVFGVWFGTKAAMGFGRDVRQSLFGKVMGYSAEEVGHFGAPSLITRITNDVQQVQLMVVLAVTMMVTAPITLVIGLVMALRESVELSVVVFISMPIALLVLGNIVRKMVPGFTLMQERIDKVNQVLREQITGLRVVRAFVREPEEKIRFELANDALTEVGIRTGRLQAAMFPTIVLIMNSSSVLLLWIGADRVGDGSVGLGALIAFISYLVQILMAVIMATFMISMIPRAAVAADRIQEVLDTDSAVVPPTDPVTELPHPGTLEFREVEFRYPGAAEPVLTGISFTVEPGTTTAVVGSTGAGKTTLVNLIPRLVDPTSGTVLVGGVGVRDIDPELVAATVGYVPQKPFLFSGTVASNLRYGRPDATAEELWEALRVAQAAGFVSEMPLGLDAPITQGGTNVSGGQRQRLSIARALIVRPDIYVFDDSFSALDLATDARLRAALKPQVADAAVVVVAQRVSTIMDATQIIVLEDGQVLGRGTHHELLATCETYVEIVASQIGDEAAA